MNVLNCLAAVIPRFHHHLCGLLSGCQYNTSVILPQWIVSKGAEAISSLITPEIEHAGPPALFIPQPL